MSIKAHSISLLYTETLSITRSERVNEENACPKCVYCYDSLLMEHTFSVTIPSIIAGHMTSDQSHASKTVL